MNTPTIAPPEPTPVPIASPCIRVCCLDDADICLGCFRTLAEITGWQSKDNTTRAGILDNCAQRREAHDQRFPTLKSMRP